MQKCHRGWHQSGIEACNGIGATTKRPASLASQVNAPSNKGGAYRPCQLPEFRDANLPFF
jgi:hypothetical protein